MSRRNLKIENFGDVQPEISLTKLMQGFEVFCDMKNLSDYSIRNYRKSFKRFLGFLLLYKPELVENASGIRPEDLHNYIIHLKKDLLPQSCNSHIKNMKAFFSWASKTGKLATNPAKHLELMKVDKKVLRTVTPIEYETLKRTCPKDSFTSVTTFTILVVLYRQGLRISELHRCNWESVNLDAGTMHIEQTKARRARIIPLHNETKKILSLYRKILNPISDAEPLIQNVQGGRLSITSMEEKIRTLAKSCGFENISCHSLRRSFCTNAVKVMPLHDVMQMSGHSDMRQLQRYLAETNIESLTDSINKIE